MVKTIGNESDNRFSCLKQLRCTGGSIVDCHSFIPETVPLLEKIRYARLNGGFFARCDISFMK